MNLRSIVIIVPFMIPAASASAQLRLRIGPDTSTWASTSGQLRLRGESWSGFNAGAPAGADHDDAFGLARVLLRADVQYRGTIAATIEVKSSTVLSRGLPGLRRTADEDLVDVQQAFAELRGRTFGTPAALRAGRFEMALGRERLMSPLDWTNTRRAFQGAAAKFGWLGIGWQAFWAEPVVVRRRKPNIADSTQQIYGLHLTRGPAEAYWLRNERDALAERRHTLGARINRRPAVGSVDYDLEAAAQFGNALGQNVDAVMAGTQVGFSPRHWLNPRVYAGFDFGGATFNQLYPLGHAYLGYIDMHGRQNIIGVSAGASIRSAANVTVQLDVHDFRRASTDHPMYAVDGSVSRPAGTDLDAKVGNEIDLTVRRTVMGGHVIMQAGASRYFAGSFLEQSGSARDISWVYAQLTASW